MEGLLKQEEQALVKGPSATRSIMKNIANILKEEGDQPSPKETKRTIVFVCTSGHHRSVGWSLLVCGIFEQLVFEEPTLRIFPNSPTRLCRERRLCPAETPNWKKHRSQIYQEAAAMFIKMNEDLGFWW